MYVPRIREGANSATCYEKLPDTLLVNILSSVARKLSQILTGTKFLMLGACLKSNTGKTSEKTAQLLLRLKKKSA